MTRLQKLNWLVFSIAIVSIYLSLPRQINLKTQFFGHELKIEKQLPPLDILGFHRDLKIKQGLDLQGGIQVVLLADMEQVDPDNYDTALESAREIISRRVDLYGVTESSVKTSIVDGQHRIVIELPGVNNPQEALDLIGQTAKLIFATPIYQAPEGSPSATPILVGFAPTDLTGADLEIAQATFETQDRKPGVSLTFKDSGAEKFARLTRENLNKPLAILIDDQPVTMPTVQTEIADGSAIITGNFTLDEAKNLSIQLNAGALPVSIKILSQKNIPATLGTQAVEKSVFAGSIGLLLVVFFMSAYYGYLGIIASLGLTLYGLITLSIYKLIPVTLTLPGIAGFILSVGMAVDSNILIFERYKEELRAGRPWISALELGFGRAWDSIKDANTATIITALILFNPLNWQFLNTSGSVRGFALTLMIGIFTSLFTGIVVTRTLLRFFYKGPKKAKVISSKTKKNKTKSRSKTKSKSKTNNRNKK